MSAIELEIPTKVTIKASFIFVNADVRYWEDATVNGKEDTDGSAIPSRDGNSWNPVIDLINGQICHWPAGTEADIHYKVCDAGEYWLLDENKAQIAKWKGHYVPNDILCVGDNGYGDYIIMKVDENGFIKGWVQPVIDGQDWELEVKAA